ncbi:IS630 transposase-related protein [Psychrobacter sp. FME5]|uniref:IS630 transposase-related protein n=1 Tax=Psychrobacter sp. FME5 TaxID=2487706 RepID=UPI001CE4AC6B|nr:IS630 transposase-related protein [Psychrobacter sp. FME5]MDN5809401.1 IS630 transposase-related protein [Staphylococcus equorum]
MTYSIDFRKQVLRSIKDGMTIREAANFYQLSTSSIHSWQQSLVAKTTRNKAPTKISNEALLKDVKQYPDDYMYERAHRLGCSKSGIESALKRLGISQKKTLEHPKSCPIKRAEYQSKLDRFMKQGYPIIYMDESGFEADTIRPYGYALIGKPCIDRYNWQAKKRTNVIGALYKKMLFALDYFDKNINGDIFYDWCKYTLTPYGRIVVTPKE